MDNFVLSPNLSSLHRDFVASFGTVLCLVSYIELSPHILSAASNYPMHPVATPPVALRDESESSSLHRYYSPIFYSSLLLYRVSFSVFTSTFNRTHRLQPAFICLHIVIVFCSHSLWPVSSMLQHLSHLHPVDSSHHSPLFAEPDGTSLHTLPLSIHHRCEPQYIDRGQLIHISCVSSPSAT